MSLTAVSNQNLSFPVLGCVVHDEPYNRESQGRSYLKLQSKHLWIRLNVLKKVIHANSVDPNEKPRNVASHQGLCCLPR